MNFDKIYFNKKKCSKNKITLNYDMLIHFGLYIYIRNIKILFHIKLIL